MEDKLAQLLEDYVARRQRGDHPTAEDYRLSAGALWADFQNLMEAESTLDEALKEEAGDLPREFGSWTLLRELGRGATGIVYEARRGDQTVALKVLRQGFDSSTEAITRFRREADACGRIHHDHVVEVIEAGEAEGRPYYAMTYLDGRSLSAIARTRGMPEPRELARRVADVADALHTIHQAGIVHRDIKPGNIMADSTGRMVLADFGLARSTGAATLTRTGEALGTPLFMSPEQLLGDRAQVDGRTDVYGLGATLYELLAGRPLFHATDWPELVRAILEERPKPLHEIAPKVPVELSRVVMKALEKRPEDRYQSAAALRDDLLAFAEGRSVAGRPVSHARHKLRKLRGRWKPLVVAAATLLVATYLYLNFFPATLTISTFPVAEVILDNKSLGKTPIETSVRPGDYTLVLRSEGFEDYVSDVHLKPGGTASFDKDLVANPDDPRAREILAERYGLQVAQLVAMQRTRGGAEDDWIEALYPRGDVRIADLDDLRIDIGAAWEATGKLEIRVRGVAVWSADFVPDKLTTVVPLPEEAKMALRPGDAFEWGFYPDEGDATTARCRLVAEPEGIAKLEENLAGQDPSLVALLRAGMLLKDGLDLAAYREAERLADAGKFGTDPLAIMQQAAQRMALEETSVWQDLIQRVDRAGN